MRMKTFWLPLVLAFLLLVSRSAAQTPQGDALILDHANLVDPSSARVLLDQTIVIRRGTIESVGPKPATLQGSHLDLHGAWVLPGLIDAHVHVQTIADAQRMLSLGVTTGRSMLTTDYSDVGLRALYEQGARDIPTILASGFPVVARPMKFEPSLDALFLDNPLLNDLRFTERIGPAGARRIVAANAEHHVDWIKVFANERAGIPQTEPETRNLTDDELAAAVEEAKRFNLPVASHTFSDDGAQAAIRAGVRTIEHGALMTGPTLTLMQERDVCFIPTLSAYHNTAFAAEGPAQAVMLARQKKLLAGVQAAVDAARKFHVRIVAGTDTDYTEKAPTLIDEIIHLREAGLSGSEALAAATSVSAACLGLEKRKGVVRPGMDADLVVYREDPTKDVAVLRRPVLIINGGKVVAPRTEIERDQEEIWSRFAAATKTEQANADPFSAYEGKLQKEGMSREEIQRQLRVIEELYWDRAQARPHAITAFFDRLFSQPAEGFSTAPSALVMDAIKSLRPGTALDIGMGQGRNSVYLAQQGWVVTGYDISGQALNAARANAGKVGVRITTVEASHDSFEFGVERWDLIVMMFAWAPVSDPVFIEKLHRSLRPGGVVLYENFVVEANEQLSESVRPLRSNEAARIFAGFQILRCDESVVKGDWGSPNGDRLVRLVARKQ